MFEIDVNETNSTIIIKEKTVHNQLNVFAKGKMIFDRPDSTLLIIIEHLTIDDFDKVKSLISNILCFTSEKYKARVFLRLPMLDHHPMLNQFNFENQTPPTAMIVLSNQIYYENKDLLDTINADQYEFIIDKQQILKYVDGLLKLLNKNAPWVENLTLKDIEERIETSERLIMILDKFKDIPCGFGRILLMKQEEKSNKERLGYVDDVIVDSDHQRKGFGWKITNYLMGIENITTNVTLCLACVDEGVGAIQAPKLYLKVGFQFVNKIQNNFGIFVTEQFFAHH